MNKVLLIGRIANDLELRDTGNSSVVNFNLAVDRRYKDANGERQTDFIPIVVWDRGNYKQATNLVRFNDKGSQIAVEGELQIRSYDNNEGQRVWVTEVIADNILYLNSKGEPREEQEPVDLSGELPF